MVSPRTSTASGRRRRHSTIRRLIPVLLTVLGILWIGAGAASPALHEHAHHDASHPDHVCAIMLASLGYCDTAASAPELRPPLAAPSRSIAEPASFAWKAPEYWLKRSQAPPDGWV